MDSVITFVAGAAIGGLLSWLITHSYYVKGSREQRVQLDELSRKLKPKNTLADFERVLTESAWTNEVIDDTEVWVADSDNTFQIIRGERTRDFRERWTNVHPDPNSAIYPVYLKINNNIIKELPFIAVDGGRIFVPMPELRPISEEEVEYFWNMNSLEVKVCRVIGSYYIYGDIRGVAKRSKVALVE